MTDADETSQPGTEPPASHKHSLNVLPHSGKVDQLRREAGIVAGARGGSAIPAAGESASVSGLSDLSGRPEVRMNDDNPGSMAAPAIASAVSPGANATTPAADSAPAPAAASSIPAGVTPTIRKKLLEAKVIEVLKKIYDPEIPLNIYELGLIYEIKVEDDDSVKVQMTLTAPACPVAGSLPGEVERKIECIPEVKGADVELVWEPQWSRERMSEAALLQLGML